MRLPQKLPRLHASAQGRQALEDLPAMQKQQILPRGGMRRSGKLPIGAHSGWRLRLWTCVHRAVCLQERQGSRRPSGWEEVHLCCQAIMWDMHVGRKRLCVPAMQEQAVSRGWKLRRTLPRGKNLCRARQVWNCRWRPSLRGVDWNCPSAKSALVPRHLPFRPSSPLPRDSSGRYCASAPVVCKRGAEVPSGSKCKCGDSRNCAECVFEHDVSRCTKCKRQSKTPDAEGLCR